MAARTEDFGEGPMALVDRGCWLALSQGERGTWSWPKALVTIGLAIAVGIAVFATTYREPAFLVGLAIVYALVLWRARRAYERGVTRP